VRTLSLSFDEFGLSALDAEAKRHGIARPELVRTAALYYLSDLGSGRIATRVPRLPDTRRDGTPRSLEIELELDPTAWDALDGEAERQQVSRERLIEHATIYYLADAASGRLAQRVYERSKRFRRDAP
jgi:metal-responsive CopG/Arc/MetJ family transcriptional regulator